MVKGLVSQMKAKFSAYLNPKGFLKDNVLLMRNNNYILGR